MGVWCFGILVRIRWVLPGNSRPDEPSLLGVIEMPRRGKSPYTKGRWMIERERCRIPLGTPPPCEGDLIGMDEGIDTVLRALNLEGASWEMELTQQWGRLVGEQVASHTRPGRMRNLELVVYVDSPVWLHELSRYGVQRMRTNIQAQFGADRIRSIRLQLDPEGAAGRGRTGEPDR